VVISYTGGVLLHAGLRCYDAAGRGRAGVPSRPMGGPERWGAVKINVRCRGCGAPVGNPLTHRCATRPDPAGRQRASPQPAAATGNAHEYTACDDDDCPRFLCRVYKEGLADGIAACPLPHQG
jgi:hypothetical protein